MAHEPGQPCGCGGMGSREPVASLPPDQRAAFLQDCLWLAGLAPSPSCCPSSFPPAGFSGPAPAPQGTPDLPASTDLAVPTPAALSASGGPWQTPSWPAEPTAGITFSPLSETCFSLSGGRVAIEGCAFSSPASVLHGKTLSGLGVLDSTPVQCQEPPPDKTPKDADEKKKSEEETREIEKKVDEKIKDLRSDEAAVRDKAEDDLRDMASRGGTKVEDVIRKRSQTETDAEAKARLTRTLEALAKARTFPGTVAQLTVAGLRRKAIRDPLRRVLQAMMEAPEHAKYVDAIRDALNKLKALDADPDNLELAENLLAALERIAAAITEDAKKSEK